MTEAAIIATLIVVILQIITISRSEVPEKWYASLQKRKLEFF